VKLRALVAEDEAPQRQALLALLAEQWPELEGIACEDGIEALEAAAAQRIDLAFLDIRMPGLDGLRVARVLPSDCLVVFTTAYDEYAIRAFELGAIDYLLKPVRAERLAQALARIRARLTDGSRPPLGEALDAIEAVRPNPEPLRWISASAGDVVRLIAVEDVLAFHAQDKYTRVIGREGEAVIRTPLKDLLPRLDEAGWAQVHRSLIVRLAAIADLRKDELGRWQLRLRGLAETFPVSQALMARFRPM
jgi:DNA-binding LytR/AlgR family response regulator